MIVEARGRKVIVRDGPTRKTYVFDTEDAALDFAAEQEDERLERMKHDLGLLVRYSDEGHPADPVLPRPGDLRRRLAEIWNAEHPDDLVELPSAEDDTDDEDVLRARTLAILDEIRAGDAVVPVADRDPVEPSPDQADDGPQGDEEPDTDAPDVDGPVVEFDLTHDTESGRLRAVMTSLAADSIVIHRTVVGPDGDDIRVGEAELPAGRVLTRHYDLAEGQTVIFYRVVGEARIELAWFTAENTPEPADTE